jgi:Flp pilus assembly protein TadG
MTRLNNHGSVLVFVTLAITLLLIMVGMGLDTGMLSYVRSQAQPAVDAAALSAVSGLISGQAEVESRVAAYNATNDYTGQTGSSLGAANVTPIFYNGSSIELAASYGTANGVRVGLEGAGSNPYTANTKSSIASPLFLTPLLNLMGYSAPATANLNVTATAVLQKRPELPFTIVGCTVGNFTASWSQTPEYKRQFRVHELYSKLGKREHNERYGVGQLWSNPSRRDWQLYQYQQWARHPSITGNHQSLWSDQGSIH